MQMPEFLQKYDSLASEEVLFEIPLRKEFILNQIGRGKRVLDVGCLGGKISQLIMEQNNEVWGVEVNPNAAKVAESRGIRVKVANVEDGLPFNSRFFDVVNAGEIVEHLYDTKNFFAECYRVLKPGGAFLFTTPNLNSLENRIRVATGGYLTMVGAYPEDHFGDHIRVFNLAKIQELCRQTGLEIDTVRGVPWLRSRGSGTGRLTTRLPDRLLDTFLSRKVAQIVGRVSPGTSKLLMVKAIKPVRGF